MKIGPSGTVGRLRGPEDADAIPTPYGRDPGASRSSISSPIIDGASIDESVQFLAKTWWCWNADARRLSVIADLVAIWWQSVSIAAAHDKRSRQLDRRLGARHGRLVPRLLDTSDLSSDRDDATWPSGDAFDFRVSNGRSVGPARAASSAGELHHASSTGSSSAAQSEREWSRSNTNT